MKTKFKKPNYLGYFYTLGKTNYGLYENQEAVSLEGLSLSKLFLSMERELKSDSKKNPIFVREKDLEIKIAFTFFILTTFRDSDTITKNDIKLLQRRFSKNGRIEKFLSMIRKNNSLEKDCIDFFNHSGESVSLIKKLLGSIKVTCFYRWKIGEKRIFYKMIKPQEKSFDEKLFDELPRWLQDKRKKRSPYAF